MELDKHAVNLSRNPLGIISMFILLVYGFASILFAFSAENFTEKQKWWFVVFLVLFPCIVLFIFTYLVVFHHQKLYAPAEFKYEENFMGFSTPKDKAKELEQEVQEEQESSIKVYKKTDREAIRKQREEEIEKAKKFEQLAYTYYERNFNYEIEENIYYKINDNKIFFDGISDKNGSLTFMKIKYLPDINFIPKYLLEKTVCNAVKVKQFLMTGTKYQNYNFRLLFTFIVDTDDISLITNLKQKIHNELITEMIPIGIRILSVKQLE